MWGGEGGLQGGSNHLAPSLAYRWIKVTISDLLRPLYLKQPFLFPLHLHLVSWLSFVHSLGNGSSASPLFPTRKSLDSVSGLAEGGKELTELTPSYIPSEHWTTCLGAMEITHQWPNKPPRPRDTRFHTKISLRQKECNDPCVVSLLCNLHGPHWCGLQCISSWPFWLWIMAVTW